MRRYVALACLVALLTALAPGACAGSLSRVVMREEIVTILGEDGVAFDGKLRTPVNGDVDKLVIYVNGAGPNTYDNRRIFGAVQLNYYDMIADALVSQGIGFFTYNTRGVTPSDDPPTFSLVDDAAYQTYLPGSEISDVTRIIQALGAIERMQNARVLLLGWGAGTIVASQVAFAGQARVDGLLLVGYANDTMADVIHWQQSGQSSMVALRQFFAPDPDGNITAEAYAQDSFGVASVLGVTFDRMDLDEDGVISAADFALLLSEDRDALFAALENGDDAWLRDHYGLRITSAWYQAHAALLPNSQILPQLDIPIFIFHGQNDSDISVEGVYAIQDIFQRLGKDNLSVQIFENTNQDLGYQDYVSYGVVPPGYQAIFDVVQSF